MFPQRTWFAECWSVTSGLSRSRNSFTKSKHLQETTDIKVPLRNEVTIQIICMKKQSLMKKQSHTKAPACRNSHTPRNLRVETVTRQGTCMKKQSHIKASE